MRCRFWLYLGAWFGYIATLVAIAKLHPERLGHAMTTYAVMTWVAAIVISIYESSRVVAYLRHRHTWYLADLRKRYAAQIFPPFREYTLAGAREFLSASDARGDPSLPYYRRRARLLRWLLPLMFVHSGCVVVVALVCCTF
jgi:hypothetical protein